MSKEKSLQQKLFEITGKPHFSVLLEVYRVTELGPPNGVVDDSYIRRIPEFDKTGLTDEQVKEYLKELVELGILEKKTREPTLLHGYFIKDELLPAVKELARVLGVKKELY